MSKEKQEKRFVQVYAQDCGLFGSESSLVVDRQTGVTYLIKRGREARNYKARRYTFSRYCERIRNFSA